MYDLLKLPSKYHSFYSYAAKVCEAIRKKIPKIKIEDEDGKYYLMACKPFPIFEAKFNNGIKIYHQVSSSSLKYDMGDGNVYEIDPTSDLELLDEEMNKVIDKAFEKMEICLSKA